MWLLTLFAVLWCWLCLYCAPGGEFFVPVHVAVDTNRVADAIRSRTSAKPCAFVLLPIPSHTSSLAPTHAPAHAHAQIQHPHPHALM